MTNKETIYRQDVLDLAKKGVIISNGSYESVCKAINEIPPAEPKTGHWIKHEHNGIVHIECSECFTWFLESHLLRNSYCPNCGANMVEPQERRIRQMPHSLRVKIKGLRYKGIITDKDCDRLCKALDNEDVLDKIRAEIMKLQTYKMFGGEDTVYVEHEDVLAIIDKYKAESEAYT